MTCHYVILFNKRAEELYGLSFIKIDWAILKNEEERNSTRLNGFTSVSV